jgi:hypothetical protein
MVGNGGAGARGAALTTIAIVIAACADPDAAFEAARQRDTVEAYYEFLDEHPDHPLATQARGRITDLQRDVAWQQAEETGTVQAYQSFLNRYPEGERAGDAAERILSLRAEAEWARVGAADDPDALRAFLEQFPDSEHTQAARARLDQLRAEAEPPEPPAPPPPPPEGDYQVQLAAFGDETGAEQARQQFESTHAQALEDVELRVEPPAARGSYFRVRTAGIERAVADELCTELQAQGQECLVVRR